MSIKTPHDEFMQALTQSLEQEKFIKLSLGHYTGAAADLKKITARRVTVRGEEKLGFTYSYKTRDIAKNYPIPEALEKIAAALGVEFQAATLFTIDADLIFEAGKPVRLTKATSKEAPSTGHDRSKNRLIESSAPYLRDLKITDGGGNVIKSAQDKFRQINRYVEILSRHLKDLKAAPHVVDMGSGKGYLTFALYDYLVNGLHKEARVTGVEYRKDMVELCNGIAKKANFKGLSFVRGAIEDYDAARANVLIALHACDTATDDAIAKGIEAQADLIVVAPCCHKQIRREMEGAARSNDLDFLTRHGIFMEREAEMVTDALRALILEYHGYSTKVFEFISDAHTPKNVLIIGTKNERPVTDKRRAEILSNIRAAKEYFGIKRHHLEKTITA